MERRKAWNKCFLAALILLSACGVILLFYPLIRLLSEAVTALLRSWGVLPGIGQVFLRTMELLLLTVLLTLPAACLITIFMYRSVRGAWLTRIQRFMRGFSRVPAVLFGLVGYALTGRKAAVHESLTVMAVLLAVMFLPYTVARLDAALREVPEKYRQAGEALGGSFGQVFFKIIIPQATPDLSRVVLSLIERILSEATALLVLMGAVMPNQVLATELFRLTWLGRQDAAVLAMGLVLVMILLRYALAEYALLDDPEAGIRAAVNRSKALMSGRKGSYFVLQLSFIGWYLLVFLLEFVGLVIAAAVIGAAGWSWNAGMIWGLIGVAAGSTLGTVLIFLLPLVLNLWLTPYVQITTANFYDAVSKRTDSEPAESFPVL